MNSTMDDLAEKLASRGSIAIGIESSIMCLVNVIAVLGNISVCYAIYRNQHLRTLSNTFVIALAVADITMASLCTPFSVATLASGRWLFGEAWCKFQGFFAFTSGMTSLLTRGLISVSRYYCIVKNARYKVLFTKRSTLVYVVLMWFVAFLDSVPPLFMTARRPMGYKFQPGKAMCLFTFEHNLGYTIFTDVCFIGLPLLVIVFCYTKVFRNVNRTNKVFNLSSGSPEILRAHVTEAKISKTLAVVVGGFAACWLPISVIDTIDAARGTLTLPREVYLLYAFLAYGSCTLNPFIYGIMSSTFRREYVLIVQGICGLKRSPQPAAIERRRGYSLSIVDKFQLPHAASQQTGLSPQKQGE